MLGGGGREHALVRALARQGNHTLYAAPGNAGIAELAETIRLDPAAPEEVLAFAQAAAIDLVVVGPEAPLVAGVADVLRQANLPVFGPNRAAAALEGSKAFAKDIMARAGVPTGRASRLTDPAELSRILDEYGPPYVVKADGLAAGKGVIVSTDRQAALDHGRLYLAHGAVLVEEFLAGPEVSLFFVSDGQQVRALSPAQDFKRLGDGDAGPNTGGMGAYSPLPWLAQRFGSEAAFVAEVQRTIAEPVISELARSGTPFIGLLYCGLIVTDAGIRVIEFNARFGDPETQVVLPRLETPLAELLLACARGELAGFAELRFSEISAVTVVLASPGYPEDPRAGGVIAGLEPIVEPAGSHVDHAATGRQDGAVIATGGRVLNVIGLGGTLAEARQNAYARMAQIHLDGGYYRRDIAERAARAELDE